ncbi:MAG: hypothetical protein ABIO99_02375 [Candidatus Limnocylindria bacterium]
MADLRFELVDEANVGDIPSPALQSAGCRTCDYWERIDGSRAAPPDDAIDVEARAALKRRRLLAGEGISGSYAMLAYATESNTDVAMGYAQFGPLSAYPRAQSIRERYPELPESPAPWVITCLQIALDDSDRHASGVALLNAVADELDGRGITAVESFPEAAVDPWLPSPGPVSVYEEAGFARAAGDDRYPVYRRELTGETDADAWSGLLRASEPDQGDGWPLPLPPMRDPDDLFRLPADAPKRPNPFGDD